MTKKELEILLVNARKSKGLSQKDVASLTKKRITRQYYGMIEKSERSPSVEVAKDIANILGIPWTLFFEVERKLIVTIA